MLHLHSLHEAVDHRIDRDQFGGRRGSEARMRGAFSTGMDVHNPWLCQRRALIHRSKRNRRFLPLAAAPGTCL